MRPTMFERGAPAPCSGAFGLPKLGGRLLRTFLASPSAQVGFDRLTRDSIYDTKSGVEEAHSLLEAGSKRNADNYAQLATLSNNIHAEDGNAQFWDDWLAEWS